MDIRIWYPLIAARGAFLCRVKRRRRFRRFSCADITSHGLMSYPAMGGPWHERSQCKVDTPSWLFTMSPGAAQSIASTSLISLSKPFTRGTLRSIRQLLNTNKSYEEYQHPKNAAVLIPFCNVNGEPSILFEMRSKALRSHSGEIRCAMSTI